MIPEYEREKIFSDIVEERERQEKLRLEGKFAYGPESDELTNSEKLAILMEEVGEVARAVCEDIPGSAENLANLREELVQVAALAVGWLEGLEYQDQTDTIPAPAPTQWEAVFADGFFEGRRIPGCEETFTSPELAAQAIVRCTPLRCRTLGVYTVRPVEEVT